MIKRNTERQNRNLMIQLLINANNLVWQNLLSFVTAFGVFNGFVSDAQAAQAQADADIKGVAQNKKNKKSALAIVAMRIKGAVQSLAIATNDVELFNTVNFSKSKISGVNALLTISRCQVIYNAANTNIGALLPYGITPAILQTLLDAITEFQELASAPFDARAARRVANDQVESALDAADNILYNSINGLMENFRTPAPTFYEQFMIEKHLIHGATHFTEIKSTILNASTHQPEFGVEMKISNALRTYTVSSNVFGVADKKQMRPSLYDVTFSKPGFVSQTIPAVDMSLSEHEEFTVELVPLNS